MDAGATSPGPERLKPRRVVGVVSLAVMTYFVVSGGPFGLELCVKAAGPLVTLAAYALMPLVWAIPQSLACAELSCMMDHNGGAVLWVQRAFGSFASWINALNRMLANAIDAALYPTLVASYITIHLGQGEEFALWIKMFVVVSCLVFNILGIQTVGHVAIAIAVSVLIPFALEVPYRAKDVSLSQWTGVQPDIDWALFLGTLIWAYSGYDDMGTVAGEVRDPSRTYIRAMLLALALTCFTYIIPTITALTYDDASYDAWDEGYFQVVGNRVSPFVGQLLLFSAIFSNYGQYNSNMATDCRVVWALAGGTDETPKGLIMLPRVFSYLSPRFGTPVVAIVCQSAIVSVCMLTNFSVLVQADTFFTCLCIFLQFASFIRLKYSEPDARRPFVCPGGLFGAWLITIPKFIIVSVTLILSDTSVIYFAVLANVLFLVAYVPFRLCKSADVEERKPLLSP